MHVPAGARISEAHENLVSADEAEPGETRT